MAGAVHTSMMKDVAEALFEVVVEVVLVKSIRFGLFLAKDV